MLELIKLPILITTFAKTAMSLPNHEKVRSHHNCITPADHIEVDEMQKDKGAACQQLPPIVDMLLLSLND